MPSKNTKPTKVKNVSPKNTTTETSHNAGSAVLLAKPTLSKANGAQSTIYDDAVKEIVALSENDAYAKKIDNGPLSEARGKDTWRLHAQVRAVDHLNINLEKYGAALKTSLATIDDHLHTNTVATTSLVERHGANVATKLHDAREAIQGWITSTRSGVTGAVTEAQSSITEAISKTQSAVNKNVKETTTDLGARLDSLQQTVKDSFSKLAKATAGTEENLRSQTNAFSKAVEDLLVNVQNDLNKKIGEFRDEATRQVDKRFNQSDVAFAAVRADQEVIKALLTDIIKDRMGRSEPRSR